MSKKKIVYITGSRADFGRAYYILKAIKESQNFELDIIATSMHLSHEFGYTIKEIEKDFQVSQKVSVLSSDDSKTEMAKSFGKEAIGITKSIGEIKPDLVIVLGDRGEMLAGAIASKHLGIPVAHIGGGHISGSIDDKIRDAITVFSDLHFVANSNGKKKTISIGADPSNVYITGAPDLEVIRKKDFLNSKEVAQKFNINLTNPLILLSFHPTVDEAERNEKEMKIVCESIIEFKEEQIIATYPNADAGGRRMIRILEDYSKYPNMAIYQHIPYKEYLGLMNLASVIVGNSSAGIIEAPSLKLPAVNIGNRQNGRERAGNVIDVECEKKKIVEAIRITLHNEEFKTKMKKVKNPYGDGQTSKYVMKILEDYL